MENYPIWIRLHPDSRDETLATAVQARMHDPLWLLGRQWQLNELRHDAGATPIDVKVEGTTAPLTRLRGGPPLTATGTAAAIKPRSVPLETLVEREPISDAGIATLRLRGEAGLHLLRMLRSAGLVAEARAWTLRCPFMLPANTVLDDETRAWWELVEGRVPDGVKLRATVPTAIAANATPQLPAAEVAVLRAWLTWYGGRYQTAGSGPSTWDVERFEYAFAAGARVGSREVMLGAPEYLDGRLEWYDFEETAGALGAPGTATPVTLYRIPAPLDFAGMPNPRFWTFEDPSSRFDALELLSKPDAAPSPATLMALDFALSYSDDWFLVPIALDAWTVFEASSVTVTDVFGDTAFAHHPAGRWNMFRLESNNNRIGLATFFLAASPAEASDGPPIEELHLLRDEIGNVAWAVERIVPHPLTHGVEVPTPAPAGGHAASSGLVWTLAPPSPPRNWFPLIPAVIGRLSLGVLWSARTARPVGTVLGELRASKKALHQEEVPPEGVQVARRWQSARAIDGSLHFWIGRSKTPRRTEVAPALQFDLVEWT